TGAVALALVFGILATSWQTMRARRAEREALSSRRLAEANEQKARESGAREATQRSVAEQRFYDLLLSLAQSERQQANVGYRRRAFDFLQQAGALAVPQKDPVALRNIGISCMGDLAGLTPVCITNFPAGTIKMRGMTDLSGRVAVFVLSDGSIQIR